jgi:hypothetical protein
MGVASLVAFVLAAYALWRPFDTRLAPRRRCEQGAAHFLWSAQ